MMSAVNLRNSSRLGCYLCRVGLCLHYPLSLLGEAALTALSRDWSLLPFTLPLTVLVCRMGLNIDSSQKMALAH